MHSVVLVTGSRLTGNGERVFDISGGIVARRRFISRFTVSCTVNFG